MKPCLPNVWRHFYTMFTDMFTPFMKICLHLDYIYVNIMLQHTFPANLKTFYIMLEDMFAICLETSLNHVGSHVYTIFKEMFTTCFIKYFCIVWYMFTQYQRQIQWVLSKLCFKAFSNYVWGHFYTKKKSWWHFPKCLSPY